MINTELESLREHSFIIIKPDGVKNHNVQNEILEALRKNNIFVTGSCSIKLDKLDVNELYKIPTDKKLLMFFMHKYLAGQTIEVKYLEGKNVFKVVSEIKKEIRMRYTTWCFGNGLHSPETHEYEVQFELLNRVKLGIERKYHDYGLDESEEVLVNYITRDIAVDLVEGSWNARENSNGNINQKSLIVSTQSHCVTMLDSKGIGIDYMMFTLSRVFSATPWETLLSFALETGWKGSSTVFWGSEIECISISQELNNVGRVAFDVRENANKNIQIV